MELVTKKQDPSLKLLVILSKAYKTVMEQVELDVKSRGISLTDFAVLELLYHRGKQPLQKIADKILLTSGSITYVVNKLEKQGYLTREQCELDKRVTYAVITDKGTELLDSIFPGHWEKIKKIMHGLDYQEKEEAIVLLRKLGTAIREL
ncbi:MULTISPECIES: MarR family transcriptional regulator [Oceanobacillus]|uniref:MarR family transcriptional regulator n=1 Tax=Oceanobacillus kimchii TaxID=746691 RepID=A0ABQ5TFM9_9BACI|nr:MULTISPECIES: MarR family transcriptional regulator [Oceanobacillus]MBT2652802.1 MarR family transcriptional regulator [Oceanobacillus sp. ISL-73]MCT1577346.1 MarR family transcriptional regulator [Oceanobacillus kimchii]MCT2136952.1 MarR family transcriptional regulator [Oceanobacillus kimchii]OEH53551.1 transcriptional regulator [Oceanobacillus sp. E9]GLO64937.1 MarR family transcriptional regulator [Oceanobacillus kimchii]